MSLREIEKRVGVPKTTIRETLIKDGIARRNFSKNQKNKPDLAVAMHSGATPFGYTYLEGKLVVDPHEYKTVLEIYRLWKSGASYRAIANKLNDRQVPTRLGKTWQHVVIKNIINRHQTNLKKGDSHGTR